MKCSAKIGRVISTAPYENFSLEYSVEWESKSQNYLTEIEKRTSELIVSLQERERKIRRNANPKTRA
jgi:hypothetical protein